MIRVAVIDGHPAIRAGVEAILARTGDVVVVAATSGDPHEVEHTLYRTTPDVVVVEDAPGHLDGVALARAIKEQPPAPGVVLYADGIDATQVATAMLAGADALIDTRSDASALVTAVRAAAQGRPVFPELDGASRAELASRLAGGEQDIQRMRLAAISPREIARLLRVDAQTLRARLTVMIDRLRRPGAGAPSAVSS